MGKKRALNSIHDSIKFRDLKQTNDLINSLTQKTSSGLVVHQITKENSCHKSLKTKICERRPYKGHIKARSNCFF